MYDEKQDEDLLLFDDENADSESDFLDNPDDDDTGLLVNDVEDSKSQNESGQKVAVKLGKIQGGLDQTVKRKGFLTDVDLVFVIDCTGSMQPFLDMVKESAKTLYKDIMSGLDKKNRQVHKLRIKVIAFRDYYFDWADPEHPPMLESEFFTLPEQQENYRAFVDKLEAAGGEDEPESSLEALHTAFNSKWLVDETISKRRQIVLLFTDASAHPLNDKMRFDPEYNAYYPEGTPESLEALYNEFMSPDVFPDDGNGYPTGHRLILFAPENMYPWNQVKDWTEAMPKPMDPEKGLEGLGMEDIITFISGSL